VWKLGERVNLQFRMDAFNLIRHPNFNPNSANGPVGSVNCGPAIGGKYNACSATNNVVSAQSVGNDLHQTGIINNNDRELQYGLKVTF